jgi:hypothetical protein
VTAMMSNRESHRSCPGCMVSMVGRKADLRSAGYDFFECRLCGTVVTYPFKESEAKELETSAMTSER